MKTNAFFYYDILSPFTYFYLKLREPLEKDLNLIPVPVFLAGLLRAQNNRGPAEIPTKREYAYKHCVWFAKHHHIAFKFPPRHPFSSAAAQRLLLQMNASLSVVEKAFDFVWRYGNDPDQQWSEFCVAIGCPADTPKPQDEQIKQHLMQNTNEAASHQIFGLPTVRLENQIFWGCESIPWLMEFIKNPSMFDDPAYEAAIHTENPLINK
jgi:2-hydroxychromene-2-carboxylate isomerase